MTSEPEPTDTLQEGLIKKMSGNDMVEARTLHSKNIVRYVPPYKLFIQANGVPAMNRISLAIQRRMKVIEFPFIFKLRASDVREPHHRLGDPDLKDKVIKTPEWRDELFLVLLEAYLSIKDLKSLPMCPAIDTATANYFDENNPLKEWLAQRYEKTGSKDDVISSTQLNSAFNCDTGIQMDIKKFKKMMEFNGYDPVHTKHFNAGYVGLRRIEV